MPELGFWGKLKKPFFVLAPMADVTDPSFRRIIAKHGKPDVLYTEFVSTDGLLSEGRTKLLPDLAYTEAERPIVAQIFGTKPDNFEKIANELVDMGFDGIDINMGCPDKSLVRSGSCAGLIDNPKLAQEIIRATQRGAAGRIPVSVKTRLGNRTDVMESWIPAVLETQPAVLTLHARTAKEMSLVPARWEAIARAVEMARGSGTLVVGNGDVKDLADAREKAAETGADGIMLGRAIFGNPFLFNETIDKSTLTLKDKLSILVEQAALFEELLPHKNFAIMRKHFGAYVKGFDGAASIRMQLMEAENTEQMRKIIDAVQ